MGVIIEILVTDHYHHYSGGSLFRLVSNKKNMKSHFEGKKIEGNCKIEMHRTFAAYQMVLRRWLRWFRQRHTQI